jgi:murein DD-endopeptidase MepM/ murein hydrolase activator NlpD
LKQPWALAALALAASAQRWVQVHPRRTMALVAACLLSGSGLTFALATLSPDAADLPVQSVVEDVLVPNLSTASSDLEAQTLTLFRSGLTRSSDTAETMLKRLGIQDPQAAAFLRTDPNARHSLLGRSGRNLTAEADEDNRLLALAARWSAQDDGSFSRLKVQRTASGFTSTLETLPMTASSRLASGSISTSLFASTDEARIPDSVAAQLADIFSGDIDFHRALRKGDRYSVVYETLEGDGEPLRAGRVLAAEFVNNGKVHQAMWFQELPAGGAASSNRSKGGYYTLQGESLRRAYLASPLEFSRVSSGFQMRFHPILKTWRAHLGVDYAAATGTPVRSVGDGVVEFAGWQNGFGNVVIVKHQRGHQTVYAHLSKVSVRRGQSVAQGQNIGAVGATGWATGPHLHFEFRVNGVHKDPQIIARQGESVPVSAALRLLFNQAAKQVEAQLAAAEQMQATRVE